MLTNPPTQLTARCSVQLSSWHILLFSSLLVERISFLTLFLTHWPSSKLDTFPLPSALVFACWSAEKRAGKGGEQYNLPLLIKVRQSVQCKHIAMKNYDSDHNFEEGALVTAAKNLSAPLLQLRGQVLRCARQRQRTVNAICTCQTAVQRGLVRREKDEFICLDKTRTHTLTNWPQCGSLGISSALLTLPLQPRRRRRVGLFCALLRFI